MKKTIKEINIEEIKSELDEGSQSPPKETPVFAEDTDRFDRIELLFDNA